MRGCDVRANDGKSRAGVAIGRDSRTVSCVRHPATPPAPLGLGRNDMKNLATASAAVLTVVGTLAGGFLAAVPASASPSDPPPDERAMHTMRLVIVETATHSVGPNSAVGTDRIRSRSSHKVVGYYSETVTLNPKTGIATFRVAFSLEGGIIEVRVKVPTDPATADRHRADRPRVWQVPRCQRHGQVRRGQSGQRRNEELRHAPLPTLRSSVRDAGAQRPFGVRRPGPIRGTDAVPRS